MPNVPLAVRLNYELESEVLIKTPELWYINYLFVADWQSWPLNSWSCRSVDNLFQNQAHRPNFCHVIFLKGLPHRKAIFSSSSPSVMLISDLFAWWHINDPSWIFHCKSCWGLFVCLSPMLCSHFQQGRWVFSVHFSNMENLWESYPKSLPPAHHVKRTAFNSINLYWHKRTAF